MNSTLDQWHVPISLAAICNGKHVSCEKPLTLSIAEGRVLADTAKKYGVVFRTDSECRSHSYMKKTAELARNGYIGKIKRLEVGGPKGDKAGGNSTPMAVPSELDYEMWMGPIQRKPYTVHAVHPPKSYGSPGWMRCRDTCEGMITNWGTHVLDVAQLVNNTERTGPVSVEATGKYPSPDSGLWNVLIDFKAHFEYAIWIVLLLYAIRLRRRFTRQPAQTPSTARLAGLRPTVPSVARVQRDAGWSVWRDRGP